MIRMMVAACLCVAAAMPLASCATTGTSHPKARPPLDLCTGATVRRAIYAATIAGTDGYATSGRAVPTAMTLGRKAAAIALEVLDSNCAP
jgi:hypothetical protein